MSPLSDAQRELLAARLRRGRTQAAATIGRRPAGSVVPLSFAQEQLWFLDRFAPGLPTYNIPHLLWLTGPLDRPALDRAVTGLVGRHESLRTRLVAGADRRPSQQIAEPAPVTVPVLDLAGQPDPAGAVAEYADKQALIPFDLAVGPLFRIELAVLGPQSHALMLVFHHSIFDAWSYGVLLQELTALYDAEVSGTPAGLEPLAIQFGDYAAWERQKLLRPPPEQLEYWRTRLAGAQPLELATDRPRPAQESFAGGVEWLNLGTELLHSLRALGRDEQTTVFVTLLTGLDALLHRYTGQHDIVIGAPSANRGRAELAPLIGFLVNTLPIRAELSGDPSFRSLLAQVRDSTTAAYAHQDVPFARVVDELKLPRDAGRAPVFQVALTFADEAAPVTATGLDIRLQKVDLPVAKFDLSFFAEVRPDGLWIELSYASDLFDVETIRRLLSHYGRLLAGAVADPSARLSELPMLTDAELYDELVGWNDTAAEFEIDCVHRLFERQVAAGPDRIAAVHRTDEMTNESISYGQLNADANRLAAALIELGVGAEVLVGISMQPSLRRLTAVLAVLKAGGGYVPLDPALPADRLAFMIEDAGLPVILADPDVELPSSDARVLVLADIWDSLAERPDANPLVEVGPGNVIYSIFTSGSTGQPKGVLVEHRNVANFAQAMMAHWPVTEADRVLQFASLNFDVSVFDQFTALLSGATAVVAGRSDLQSPVRLRALLRDQRVSVASMPPAVLSLLADGDYPNLRVLISAGEELTIELAQAWLRPGLRLVNGYGPTETTVLSACAEITPELMPPPIGRPPANYQAYVLDQYLNPVPVGVVGQLHTGGAGVARGYLNRPELTAERFIDDPFADGGKLYRTGDLVKRRADGNLHFLGRLDGQVKLRGLRVELGEVEAALVAHPEVAQAVVVLRADRAGQPQLVGYLRPAGTDLDLAGIRQHLAAWLPAYMVPAVLVPLAELPINTSGKLDKAALPEPSGPAPADRAEPATMLEALLAGTFGELVESAEVGAEDSFFEIGGNSLQAMQLVGRIEEQLEVQLRIADVFIAPDPRRLAALLSRGHGIEDGPLEPASAVPAGLVAAEKS